MNVNNFLIFGVKLLKAFFFVFIKFIKFLLILGLFLYCFYDFILWSYLNFLGISFFCFFFQFSFFWGDTLFIFSLSSDELTFLLNEKILEAVKFKKIFAKNIFESSEVLKICLKSFKPSPGIFFTENSRYFCEMGGWGNQKFLFRGGFVGLSLKDETAEVICFYFHNFKLLGGIGKIN